MFRRVRGYTKHPGSTSETNDTDDEVDLDDVIMLGDLLAVKVKYTDSSVALVFVKIASMKNKNERKYTTIIPSISIGDYYFDGRIYEGKITNDILILKHSSIEEICTSIDGSFCVLVWLRGLCLEGGRAAELMKQIPISSKVVSNSKLLPYDESLVELFASEEIQGGKLKCKLCEKIIPNKNMRRHVGGHILKEKLVTICGFS